MWNNFKKKKKAEAEQKGGVGLQITVLREMRTGNNASEPDDPDQSDGKPSKSFKPGKEAKKRAKLFGKGPR